MHAEHHARLQMTLNKLLVLQYSTAGHGKSTMIIEAIQEYAGLHFEAYKRPAHLVITAYTNYNVNEFEAELSACYKDPLKPFTFEVVTLDSFCNQVIGLNEDTVAFENQSSIDLARAISGPKPLEDAAFHLVTQIWSDQNTLTNRLSNLVRNAWNQGITSDEPLIETELRQRLTQGRHIDLLILDECQDAKDIPRLVLMMLFLTGRISHMMLFGDYMQRIYDASIHIRDKHTGIKCFQVDSDVLISQARDVLARCKVPMESKPVHTEQLAYKVNSWRLNSRYVAEVNAKLPAVGTFSPAVIENFACVSGLGTNPEAEGDTFVILDPYRADLAMTDPQVELIMGDRNLLSNRRHFAADVILDYSQRHPGERKVIAVFCEPYFRTLNAVMTLLTHPHLHLVSDYAGIDVKAFPLDQDTLSLRGDKLFLEWIKGIKPSLLNTLLDTYVYADAEHDKERRQQNHATAFLIVIKFYYTLLMTGLESGSPACIDLPRLLALKKKDFKAEQLIAHQAKITAALAGKDREAFVLAGVLRLLNRILLATRTENRVRLAEVLLKHRISTLKQMLDVLEMRFGHQIILDICKAVEVPIDFILYTTSYKMKGGTIEGKYIYLNSPSAWPGEVGIDNARHSRDSRQFVALTRSKVGGYVINDKGAKIK